MLSTILFRYAPAAIVFEPYLRLMATYWDRVKEGAGMLSPALANWSGFGVDLTDLTSPKVALFFRGAPPVDLDSLNLPTLPFVPQPKMVGGLRFASTSSSSQGATSATALQPGATIRYEGEDAAGNPVGPEDGTVGAFVRVGDVSQPWLLTANHVIGMNGDFPTNRVSLLGGPVISTVVISISIVDPGPNRVDAAIARIDSPLTINAAMPGLHLADATELPGATRGTEVAKVSGAAMPTVGKIAYAATRVEIDLSACCGVPNAAFEDQFLIADGASAFSKKGDSGSMVVTTQGGANRPLGILIANHAIGLDVTGAAAGQPLFSVVTPIDSIIDEFRAKKGISLTLIP